MLFDFYIGWTRETFNSLLWNLLSLLKIYIMLFFHYIHTSVSFKDSPYMENSVDYYLNEYRMLLLPITYPHFLNYLCFLVPSFVFFSFCIHLTWSSNSFNIIHYRCFAQLHPTYTCSFGSSYVSIYDLHSYNT